MIFNLKLLENGYLRVGVVGNSDEKRAQMKLSFDGLGFQDLKVFSSYADLKEAILKGKIQWALCTLKDEQGDTLVSLMDEIYQEEFGLSYFI